MSENDKSRGWSSIKAKELNEQHEPTTCKGLYNLNYANDLTTGLCLALFNIMKEKNIVTEEEITNSIKIAMSQLPKFRMQMMDTKDMGTVQ